MSGLQRQFSMLWKLWFTPRSTDPAIIYRERALRVLLPVIALLRPLSIWRNYSGEYGLYSSLIPPFFTVLAFVVPVFFSFYFLARKKVDLAGLFFILHWFFADLPSLQTEGYWYPGYQISLILQVILGALFLPGNLILPYWVLQIATVGIWGYWLDANYYDAPLLATGQPVAIFWQTMITLASQELIIVFVVRYLRTQMEKSLQLQQDVIRRLETEVAERQMAETRLRNIFVNSPDLILEIDRAGNILFANRNQDDYVGRQVWKFILPVDFDLVQQAIVNAFETGKPAALDLRTRELDGTYQWNSIRIGPMRSGGQVSSLEVISTNIQSLKETVLREQQRAEQLSTMLDVSHGLSTLQDIDKVFELVYQQVRRIAPADAFFICIYDDKNNNLSFPLTYDLGVRYEQADSQLTRDTPLAHAMQTGEPVLLLRTAEEIAELEKEPGDVGNPQRRSASLLYLPLWRGQEVIGAMSIQSYALNAFPDDLIENLMGIADQTAIAIQNARLFSGIQQELAERKRAEEQVRQLNIELEQRVLERTAELVDANREMEAFAYSVSHDLRAPLRAMSSFAKIIKMDFSAGIQPEGLEYLEKIMAAGAKMNKLIDDLLGFSRTTRKAPSKRIVDMNAVVRSVIDLLAHETRGRQIEWNLASLPAAECDPILIQQVFANLIGNALKYSARCEQSRVTVGSFEQDGEVVYFVRDNGAGFDMRYADKLFGVFQRLHSEAEFEGSGIGLATVQRIIHRHGGRIWAEAEVDKGATFYFTLG